MIKRYLVGVVIVLLGGGPVSAAVINHFSVGAVGALPQSTMNAVGTQKWFFSHASVGGNMVGGMNALHTADAARYQFVTASVGYNSAALRANDPPAVTLAGRIYECNRGNPGWSSKCTIFDNSVEVAAWRDGKVDVVMDKMCYIDQAADANSYLNTMALLEGAYPNTRFVYATMPLTTAEDSSNILRNNYNAAVRAFCIANNKLLFDIADIEAHDPSGNPATFLSGGQTYQKLYSGYTTDGGHLTAPGQEQVALGWYATAASLVPEPGSMVLLGGCVLLRSGRRGSKKE